MKRANLVERLSFTVIAGFAIVLAMGVGFVLFGGAPAQTVLTRLGLAAPAEQLASALPIPSPSEREVQAAWRRAQQAGTYHFATDILQTTYPAPRVTNVGRSSRQDTLHIEGETNLPDRTMQMALWQNGGSVLNPGDGVEIRIEGDQAYGRQSGGAWQKMDNIATSFAPGNDLLAYLAGAKNVRKEVGSRKSGVGKNAPTSDASPPTPLLPTAYSRYSFDVDGPAFGRYMRDQLERYLQENGELPAGLTLDVSNQYRSIIGHGEVWIDSDGLPHHLTVHLEYPQQPNGERIAADIKTDFSQFDRGFLAQAAPASPSSPLSGALAHLDLSRATAGWGHAGTQAGLLAAFALLTLMMVAYRDSKKVYAAVALAIIVSTVAAPLLRVQRVAAFSERQTAQRMAQQQAQKEQATVQELRDAYLTSDWDPHKDPLAAANRDQWPTSGEQPLTIDPSQLTIDNSSPSGSSFGSASATAPAATSDADHDGLTYAQEVLLGTDPNKADSDGDKLRDDLEVKGFDLGGKHWYSDPSSPDTNNDGLLDTMECWGTIPSGVSNTPCDLDTDSDGTPNLFDRDNDNDGVPDRVDSAPDKVVLGFSDANPLKLVVDNLKAKTGSEGYPVFVDFQIRPSNPDHLAYAMNVLDWPSGDRKGQVQRVKDNTLADQMNPQPPVGDANRNGDMRLVPMLEIKIPASSGQIPPLPLTAPQATRQVQGYDGATRWISATLKYSQQGNDTKVQFQLEGATSDVTAKVYASACPAASDSWVQTDYHITNAETRTIAGTKLTSLLDGKHSVVLSHGDNTVCANLGDIPNGPYSDKMIDTAKLQTHGISVRDSDDKGNMVAYAPLNLTNDETGGSKVAFAARMVYWPNSVRTWGKAHEVRVVWLVQALTDSCSPTPKNWHTSLPEEQRRTAWCLLAENWVTSSPSPVHTYPEDWNLTGLSVREDHGMEVAVAYEDPAHDSNKKADDSLWKLADGLQKTFASPRDQDKNKIRDIGIVTTKEGRTVADETIKGRFDNQSNSYVSSSKLWGIPRNALRVQTYSYPHQDYLAKIPSAITPDILKTYFSHDDAPTLLFAREEYHRTAGLDMTGGIISVYGSQVKVNMSSAKVPQSTLASMNWGPYRYRNGQWEAYPLDKYWDKMAVSYKNIFEKNPPKDENGIPMYSTSAPDAEVVDGLVTASQAYYISMVQGSNKVVAFNYVALVTAKVRGAVADASLAQSTVNSVGAGLELIANQVSGDFISLAKLKDTEAYQNSMARIDKSAKTKRMRLKAIARMKKKPSSELKAAMKQTRRQNIKMGAKAGLSVAALSMSIAASYTGRPVLKHITNGLAAVSEIVDTVETLQSVAKAWREAKTAASLSGRVATFSGTYRTASNAIAKDIHGSSMKAGIVLTVIAIAVTMGVFIAVWAEGGYGTFGGLAFNAALSGMIATIIATVIMFAISLIPVIGQIIAAVIAVIDALIQAVCAIADAATDETEDYAFNMDLQYQSDLSAGTISNGFRQQYIIKAAAYNNGRDADEQLPSQLSTDVTIEKKSGSKWIVTDNGAGQKFIIRKKSTKLNVNIPGNSFSATGFGKWFCKGISGLFTYAIQWSIYSQTSLVGNLHSDSRTQTMDFHPALVNAGKGFSAGNQVKYSLKVVNAITLADVPFDWKAAIYFWQYTYANLDSATVKHVLKTSDSTSKANKIKGLKRNQIEDRWQRKSKYLDGETALVMSEPLSSTLTLDETGINRPVELYLAEAYAVPTQECWGIPTPPLGLPLIPVCYIRTDDNDGKTTFSDLGKSLQWDVFPATLDGFYACESSAPSDACHKDGGYSLGWGQTGDLTFPRMKDFDGDGLLNKKDGGNDPNDSKWDTDGDGLSDLFELKKGSDPTLADSDGDGLNDYDEIRLGTNPNRQDSDGDGLTDKQEIDGWEFVYALKADRSQLKTWVTSDPLSIDGDGDTLTDFQEKVYGFNPRVKSDLNLLDYSSKIIEPDAPVMLLRFEETDGATTFSDVSGNTNNGACQGGACPAAGHLGRYGNAAVFDGSGDYLNAGGGLDLANKSFTVAFWAKRDAVGGHNMFAFGQGSSGVNQALQLGFRDNNTFTCGFYGNDLDTSASYADQNWHHWACTYDAATRRRTIYRDGTQVAQDTASANYQGSGDMFIGKAPWGDYFSGRLDELAVFSKALSQNDVQAARDARYNYNDSIVKPGQTITYQGTVENKLFNRYVNGLLSTDFPSAVQDNVPPASFILQPAETQTLSGDVTVKSSATSGKAILSQVAGGIVVNRREESGYAELWLPFNESSSTSSFSDFSGNMPARNGVCSGSSCPQAGQNGVIGNAVKFDGSNDFLNAGNRVNLAGKSFTVAFWAKRDATGGRNMFVIGQGTESTNHALQLGFRSNNKFTCGFYGNDLDTDASYSDQNWHHWACTYDAAGGSRTIYRDGLEVDGDWHYASYNYQGSGNLYVGKAPWGSNFSGAVDDVRVYARALSADEIARLAGIPVLKMGLGESGSQFFAAGVDQHASCSGSSCPSQTSGISGSARDFNGSDYITLSSGVPDLRNEDFTFSVWINPQDSSQWRGVWGSDFGGELGYPGMAIRGRDLRFGFGNEAQWIERITASAVTLNTWNHVVVTFDGTTYRLYVDGVKKDETGDTFSGQRVDYSINKLYLGRASNTGTVYLDHLQITDEGDGSGNAELCIAWRDRPSGEQRQIWENNDVDVGDYDVKKSLKFRDEGYLRIWEDDGGTYCGSNQDDGDDFLWHKRFSIYDPDILTQQNYRILSAGELEDIGINGGDSTGYVWLGNQNTPAFQVPSLPFKGKMDEFGIYKRALSTEEVGTLYGSYVNALHLPFDEPPGAGLSRQGFANVADITGQSKGACSGSSCPTSGVTGRVNQAALFDGSNDYVDAGSSVDLANQSFTLSAWAKRNSTGSYDMVIGQGSGSTNHGLQFGFRDNNRFTCAFWGNDLDTSAYHDTNWHQWTCTYDTTSGKRTIFRDEVPVAQDYPSAHYQGSGDLTIGRFPNRSGFEFNGLLDDVRVYRKALSVNEVSLLYLAAPRFQLHFDEAKGASTFHDGSDNNHNGTCSGNNCPKAGVKGQMGLAAEFDGQNDTVQLLNASTLELKDSSFTVMAWIKGSQFAKQGDNAILGTDERSNNQGLHLVIRDGKPFMGFYSNDTAGTTEIKPNFWYHLTWRYDKDKGEQAIFVNGSLDTAKTGHSAFQGNGTVYVGRALGGRYFNGRIDELAIYHRALSDKDIRDIFLYQGSWVEERDSHEITIDTDTPTSELSSYLEGSSNYRPNQDAIFGIQVNDTTSSVKLAELGVKKDGQSSYTWVGTAACQDSVDAAWCPTFKPADFGGEGTYTFQTRATDAVGQRESPSKTYSLYVDGTPPNVTTTTSDGALLTPRLDSTQSNTWLLSFSGTVSDPNLSSGVAGSGLVADSVRVRLVDADGQTAGKTAQPATVFGSQWSVEYPLYQANPTGVYTLTVEAADNVGNQASTALATFQLDASPAGAELDTDAVSANIISDTVTLQGVAQDTPSLRGALLRLHLDEAAGSHTFIDTSGRGNHATCSGSACPTAGEIGKFGKALLFDGANSATLLNSLDFAKADYTVAAWFKTGAAATQDILSAADPASGQPDIRLQLASDGKLHYLHRFPADSSTGSELVGSRSLNDNAWHHLAAVKRGSTLSLYVDGAVVGSGNDSAAASEALAVTLGQNFNGLLDEVQVYNRALSVSDIRSLAQTQVSGVAGVDIAFTPRSGSAPFYDGSNADPQLHLPFEQNFATDRASLPNTADETRPATLHSGVGDVTNKAVPGAVGSYALQLDGVDDYLSVDNGADLTADQLSVCAWVKPQAGNPAGAVIAQRWAGSSANWALRMGSSGFAWQHSAISTYNNMQSAAAVAVQWYHLCGVAEATRQVLYVNGEKVTAGWGNSASGSGSGLNLGRQVGSSANYFKGAIDDVRLYPRAISADEVNALYHSGWQPADYSSGLQALSQAQDTPELIAARAQASSNLACQTYSSSDTPVAINDYRTSLSSITVPDDFSVDDINLTINLQHTWDGDLSGYLIAPNGERITLFNRRGGSGDNYTNTQFDDEADTVISSGAAPFTGQFRPESALSAAEGQPANGTWQLRVDDHAGGDQGQITNWSLELCSPPVPPPPPILAAAGAYDTPGHAKDVAVAGNYAYVADGSSGLRVIDISNPASPSEVGFYRSTAWGWPGNVTVAGNYAYVTDESSGLRVIDISNPASLSEVGSYNTPGNARGVAVAGTYAYVADGYAGLRVIGISNPASPSEVGSYDTPGYAYGVAVAGNYAYVADHSSGLRVIDISNPASPSEVGSYDTPGIAWGVAVAGNYAYVADQSDGVRVIDISNPASPSEVGSYDTPGDALGVAGAGDYAFIANEYDGVWVIDVSDPAHPAKADSYDTPGYAQNVAIAGGYAYVADFSGLQILSAQIPTPPPFTPPANWSYHVPAGLEGNYQIDLRGRDSAGLVDASTNSRNVWNGEIDTLAPRVDISRQVVGDKFRYTSSAEDYNLSADRFSSICGAGVYDPGDYVPGAPGDSEHQRLYRLRAQCDFKVPPLEEVGAYDTDGTTYDVALDGSHLYVADDNEGLRVLDVSDPRAPREVGHFKLGTGEQTHNSYGKNYFSGVDVSGDYAYLSDDSYWRIVNVSDPTAPREVGHYVLRQNFYTGGRAGVYGNYAYIPDYGKRRLDILDISDPANPAKAGIKAIAAGSIHTCALTAGGGVKCWGDNSNGRLGDGTTTDRPTPVDVVGLSSGVIAIAAGHYHTCALTVNGGVKCWGYNSYGQLGDGTTTERHTPVDVVGLSSGVTAITAGGYHTCALTSGGGVKCWGSNSEGKLGDGTTTDRHTPVDVVGLSSGVTAIASGHYSSHTCALTSGGGVKCWGYNWSGQLGDGTTTDRHTPVWVSGLSSGVRAIVAGAYRTCALTFGGGVKCWGSNGYGALGDGTTTDRHTPVDVSGAGSNVKAITAGSYHTCALFSINGWLRCWGGNWDGQLGDGSTTDRHTPVDVSGAAYNGFGDSVMAIAGGHYHTCALTPTGVKCWGWNAYGQLGDGTTTQHNTPVDVSGLPVGEVGLPVGQHGSGPVKVIIEGRYAYVTALFDGLVIVDLSNPGNPQVVGHYTGPVIPAPPSHPHWPSVPYPVEDVAVSGNYAYVAKGWEGLVVLDIRDKSNPYKVGQLNPPNTYMNGVSLSGSYAYMVDNYGGAWLVDIVNPRSPAVIRNYHLDMLYSGVVADGNLAYIAAREDGVRVAHSDLRPATESITACDTFDHCVTKSITETNPLLMSSLAQTASPVAVSLMNGVDPVLDNTDPLTITGSALADNYLQSLSATVNGAPLYSDDWPVTDTITNTQFSFGWTPSGEGSYLLDITARDWLTNTASYTQTVIVDSTPPAVGIATDALTGTDYVAAGQLDITGLVTDTNLNYLDVTLAGAGDSASGRAAATGNAWTYTWKFDQAAPPDNLAYTVYVTATDVAGWQTSASRGITVDVAAPEPVELSVSSNQSSVVSPTATIREISPTLTLTWTQSSSKDLTGTRVGWMAQTSGVTQTSAVWQTSDVSDPRSATYTAGEAQKLDIQLAGEDALGNQRWQSFGPIYVDGPLTPDYVDLTGFQNLSGLGAIYHGWMDSGCTLVGTDNRIRDKAQQGAALSSAQNLYTSWDARGLRLAWTGADWNTDGDLFIYLDTGPGGSVRAYDPYTNTQNNTAILLPAVSGQSVVASGQMAAANAQGHRAALKARVAAQASSRMAADYVVWVRDSGVATLLRWDATYEEWRTASGDFGYALTPGDVTTTDLYLPFDLIGLPDPATASLALAAFATEDDGLRLWATMPARNNVNSPRILDAVITTGVQKFPLTHGYAWPSLGAGVCANGSQPNTLYATRNTQSATQTTPQYTGSDVRLSLSGDPTGIAYSVLGDNLFFAMSSLEQFAGAADWNAILSELCQSNPDAPECGRTPQGRPANSGQTLPVPNHLPAKQVLAQQNAIPAPPGHGGTLHSLSVAANSGQNDYNAQEGLAALMDVNNPPLGDGQEVTFTLRYVSHGTGPATGLMADIVTWGPMRLPDGTALSDAQGDYDWLLLPLGDLAAGEEKTITFRGRADLNYDPGNRNGWATIDVVVYDSTGSVYNNQLDWLYMDFQYDDKPPAVGVSALPALLGPGANSVGGFATDDSGVPQVTLRSGGQSWNCPDDTPENGTWDCTWDVSGAGEGDTFTLQAQGADAHGLTGPWTNAQAFTVDATPPLISFDAATEDALNDGLIGANETTFSGQLTDNRLVDRVEALDSRGVPGAVQGNLLVDTTTLPQVVHTYDDVPDSPIAIGARTACYGGTEIYRTFTVTDSFTVGDVDLSLNVDHEYRYDVTGWLVTPSGTWAAILWNGTGARNYDMTLNDAATLPVGQDKMDHDTGVAYYENERRPDQPLSLFNGEPAQGNWQLILCDYFPNEDDGFYNRSRLSLTADTLPQNTRGDWTFALPNVAGEDNITRTVVITGVDSVGNRSVAPLERTFRVDTVAPAITVTQAITEALFNYTGVVLSGTVSDGSAVTDLRAYVEDPDGVTYFDSVVRDGNTWRYAPSKSLTTGLYKVRIEAMDEAGNVGAAGPFNLNATCTATDQLGLALHAEPVAGTPYSVTLSAVLSNTGAPIPAGLPIAFYVDDLFAGTGTITLALTVSNTEAVSTTWSLPVAGDYNVIVALNDDGAGHSPQALCGSPPLWQETVTVMDVPLTEGWNLMSSYVNPLPSDASVVQRTIAGQYAVIQGFDGGTQSFYPDLPASVNTLKHVDGLHGYWIKIKPAASANTGTGGPKGRLPRKGRQPPTRGNQPQPKKDQRQPEKGQRPTIENQRQPAEGQRPTIENQQQPAAAGQTGAAWRFIGAKLAENRPILLQTGWNLVGFLPRSSLGITSALQSIAGQYSAVLGYAQGGALSYYPDLDDSFNTLQLMEPQYGYWIRVTQPVTLTYPATVTATAILPASPVEKPAGDTGRPEREQPVITGTPAITVTPVVTVTPTATPVVTPTAPVSGTVRQKPDLRAVERAAGVVASATWMNFYGRAVLPDGTPLLAGSVVQAVDPDGVVCGATQVTKAGQYGLLACYGDDPTTDADEGAQPGDRIRLVVDGQELGVGTWSARSRQWVSLGAVKVWRLWLPVILSGGSLSADKLPGGPTSTATVAPSATALPTATPTPTPTATVAPSATALPTPTATVVPSTTALPASTPAVTATVAATVAPSATALPASTPVVTATVVPSATALPTATPAVTATVAPSATALPTATPVVTATVAPVFMPTRVSPGREQ